jgi:hypothetical protein
MSGTASTRGSWQMRDLMWGCVCLLWFTAAAAGMLRLWQYKATAGVAAEGPPAWPVTSRLRYSPQHPTLVMLVHPRCACTRASLAELSKLMTRLEGQLEAHVLFILPAGAEADFGDTDTWRAASKIRGVSAERDPGGVEAARFGAVTSGQTLLYGTNGRLLFSGGLTVARGHEGDSPGDERIVSLVTRGTAELATAPVFGCRLRDSTVPEFSLLKRNP